MFKIKIENVPAYRKAENIQPYLIRYELIPDNSKNAWVPVYHQSTFTSYRKALKVAADLSIYLNDAFIFLDLVYTKLKQLEISVCQDVKYLKIDFNRVERGRISLLKGAGLELPAYKHIENLKEFLGSLKYWCFAICEKYTSVANQLFKFLLDFEEGFVNGYRSAQMLSEKHSLKLFI